MAAGQRNNQITEFPIGTTALARRADLLQRTTWSAKRCKKQTLFEFFKTMAQHRSDLATVRPAASAA
jgi:hypothetical protein